MHAVVTFLTFLILANSEVYRQQFRFTLPPSVIFVQGRSEGGPGVPVTPPL